MGEVFLARSVGVAGFQKYVVIKKILPHLVEQPQFVEGLVREAKLMVMLDHPNIVQVIDLGVENNSYFMAMEFVNGYNMATIAHYCAQKRVLIPANAVASIVLGVLAGLDYAHTLTGADGKRQNIIHRDISPQNVMVSRDARVKLTDFGIAKVLNEAEGELTQSLKGKFRYMAPEVVDGGRIDRRYDIFGAGILLFEGLCRRHLFGGRSDVDILNQVREARVPPIERYHPDISPAVADVTTKALTRDPNLRYQSAGDFARALREAIRPASENDAEETLREFINDLYQRDDFPINKPKLPDLEAVALETTRSLVLESHLSGGLTPDVGEPRSVRHASASRGGLAIAALAVGLLLLGGVVAYLAYALLWNKPVKSGSGDKPVIIISPTPPDAFASPPLDVGISDTAGSSSPSPRDQGVDKRRKRPKPHHRGCVPRKFTPRIGHRVTTRNQSRITRCMQRYLKPGQSVRLVLTFEILRSGKVSKVTAAPSAAGLTPVGRCFLKVARRMRFPCHTAAVVTFRQPVQGAIGR
ncbi:MAG: serine/threonine protein kinase [Deltaproteobacteria bacterium]|nr:serine/threonine protein kinase [Deltaproteobacteria bacterium]